ncbi:hypothetical protein BY996DRAFT_6463716 [Phakopsora pachyrhizi]|nr:hypothetical protein BY996DRAFT_6463716 [Phakopsora pachyrhizi]
MASVLDFAKKNLGLATDPKLHFRATALNQLHSSKHPIPVTDKSYWLTYYLVFDFASKVPTLIPISEFCKAIRDRPENVENLLRVLILKLDSLIQSQTTWKTLEEMEWNSLGSDDGSGPQNISNISSSLKSQIKSFSLKVPTSIYNGAAGSDLDHHPILVICASQFPGPSSLPIRSNLNSLLKRLLSVISPITLVGPYLFIIFASPSDNAPTLKQIFSSYLILDPSTRKNLKSFNVLHPSFWSKLTMQVFLNGINLYSSGGLQVQPQTRTHNQSLKLKEHSNYHRQDSTQRESSEDHPPQLLSGLSERHTTGLDQRMQAPNRDWERLLTKSSTNHREVVQGVYSSSSSSSLSSSNNYHQPSTFLRFLNSSFNLSSSEISQIPKC